MARNLVLLPSGAVGLDPDGALSFADNQGGCAPCCGGGGGGPSTCCIQVAPDGSLCGLQDAPQCGVTVTGSAQLTTTANLVGTVLPNAGGVDVTLINLSGSRTRSDLTGWFCSAPSCAFQLAWSQDQGEARTVTVPDGGGGTPFVCSTRAGLGGTGSIQEITDAARLDAPVAGLWRTGNTLVRRGVLVELLGGGQLRASPSNQGGGTPGLPGINTIIAANIIRVGTVPRPSQAFADFTLGTGTRVLATDNPAAIGRATGWSGPGTTILEASASGAYTVERSGCTVRMALNARAVFRAVQNVPSQNQQFFTRVAGEVTHELAFELVTTLTSCTAPRGPGGVLSDAAAAILARMGA